VASNPYVVLNADDIEPFTHPADPKYHSQHVLGTETGADHDLLLNRGTVDPQSGLGGGNHPVNDEVYYGVSGSCLVDLGGDPDTGVGGKTYRLREGSVVMIPAGTFHRLRNDTDEPFVLLTVWPQTAPHGANGIHDLRKEEWGTGFRLRDGVRMVDDGGSRRAVAAGSAGDPLVG
jgi:mannose-6-phosphate isomerase-like protein (cupin superfamily)